MQNGEVDINRLGGLQMGDMRGWLYGSMPASVKRHESFFFRPAAIHKLANIPGGRFPKTHSCNGYVYGMEQIPREFTKNAIYLVRDPRDVAISYAHHTNRSIDDVIETMERKDALHDQSPIFQYMGRWCDHVESWLDAPKREQPYYPVLVIRYEDMLESPHTCFGQAMRFLGVEGDLDRAIEETSFQRLSEQENEGGFRETFTGGKFFRSGKSEWREKLSRKQIARIEKVHGKTMRKLGYERYRDAKAKGRRVHRGRTDGVVAEKRHPDAEAHVREP